MRPPRGRAAALCAGGCRTRVGDGGGRPAAQGAGGRGGLLRLRHLRARRDPGGGRAAARLRGGGLARADALDGGADRLARRARRALARGALGDHAGRGLHARGRPAGDARAARPRDGQRLCARARLPRPRQAAAEAARPLAGRRDRGGDQGLRRYRAGDGEAAGAGGRDRLAGQAHQPAVARARQLVLPRRDLHHARAAARPGRAPTAAARAGPASTPARPGRSRRPTGSMPAAASAT